ncbi:MAG: 16S rRNA pseudouridine(516) synthase [Ruminococcus sp.]|nr:16S rRNA pseudouridine(516) synthase [Ruminococcus sp.]
MPLIRLDKFISERTEYTRSQIKSLCAKGSVTVNGSPVKKSDTKIDADVDRVNVCGNAISSEKFRYILLNKPKGYVSSTDDKDGETVIKLVPPEMRSKGLFPAGRLDKDSTGALLITDDGALAHRICSPNNHISKIYAAELSRPFEQEYVEKFAKGIVLANGEACSPCKVRMSEISDKLAFVELHEGMYHQVKRMFAAVGNHVENLKRISIGGLVLPENLPIGKCMYLLPKDIERMFTKIDFDAILTIGHNFFSAN